MSADPGRLTRIISADIGWNLLGGLEEHGNLPDRIAELRKTMSPLRSELKMIQERYASRGRSPSHHDEIRSSLLAQLKEEVREKYNEDPDQRVDAKSGSIVKIELTDGRCEDMARAKPKYQDLLRRANRDRKRMGELHRELGPMYDEVERLKGIQQHLKMRTDAAIALTNAWGRESKLTP